MKLVKKIFVILLLIITQVSSFPVTLVYAQQASTSAQESSPSASLLPVLLEPREIIDPNLTDSNLSIPPSFEGQNAVSSAQVYQKAKVLNLEKKNYQIKEKILLRLENASLKDIYAKVTSIDGEEIKIRTNPVTKNNALIGIEIVPPYQLKPGKYTVEIFDAKGSISTQDFTWGVLAINTNKSMYSPNETAKISIAVLSERGEMVCDAKVVLDIEDPKGEKTTLSTGGQIKVNPECNQKKFTLVPDYETSFTTNNSGTYKMTLSAETGNGSFTINDSFEVKTNIPFGVERITATRIYPPLAYPVSLKIKANQDFEGKITDIVPASFDITPSVENSNFTVTQTTTTLSSSDTLIDKEINLKLPFKGDYNLTQGFGDQPDDPLLAKKYFQYGVAGHDGVDFDLPANTPVLASDTGEVVYAKNGDYGKTVIISHKWGKTYYGHLNKINVQVGQVVEQGEQIALSGNTGLSTGFHLHFGIKKIENDPENGFYGKIDPLPALGYDYNTSISTNQTVKVISFDVSLKKGEEKTLSYNFKAPNESPQFYLLGPLRFANAHLGQVVFEEARNWQIAADVTVSIEQQINIIDQEASTTSTTYAPTDNSLGLIRFDTTKYSGTLTLKFEAVVKATGGNDVGQYASIFCPTPTATDCKVAYYDNTSGDLLFLDCDDATCSTGTVKLLDGNTGCVLTGCATTTNVGQDVSLYCPTATDCKISYEDVTNGDLKFADCDDAQCSTGTVKLLDGNTGCVLTNCSTSAGSGSGTSIVCPTATDCKISFNGGATQRLSFADCDDATCSTGTIKRLDGSTGCVLTGCSTTDDTSATSNSISCPTATDCKIAYRDLTNTALKFADCDDAQCGTGTVKILDGNTGCTLTSCSTTADTADAASIYCVTTTDCKIAYRSATGEFDLKFADCDDATCSTGTARMLDGGTGCPLTGCATGNSVGSGSSIYCLSTTDCKIAYNDFSLTAFKFADCDDATCSTGTVKIMDGDAGCVLTGCATGGSFDQGTASRRYSLYCLSATDCKAVAQDFTVGVTDLKFEDCDDATCSTGTSTTADSGANTTAGLFNSSGTQVSCASGSPSVVEVSTANVNYVRTRTGDGSNTCTFTTTQLTTGDYTIRLKATGTAYVKAARLIIIQSNATNITDTQTHVEVGNNTSTTSTSATALTDPKYYLFDKDKFSGTVNAYLEASIRSVGTTVTVGPNSAGASGDCVQVANADTFATVSWTSPGNAFSSNNTYATASVDGSATEWVQCTNFAFSIPTGVTIAGIVVEAEVKSSSIGNGGSSDFQARIVKGGTIGATDKASATTYGTADDVYISHGSSTDLWGETWAAADINASNFGFALSSQKAAAAGPAHTVSVDHIRITVYYTEASGTASAELFNRTDSLVVGNSTITTTSTSWTRVRGASALSTNWDTVNDDVYELRIYSSATTARTEIANAKIIIEQTAAGGLTDIETVQQYNNTLATDADATYTSQDFDNNFDKSNFSGGTFVALFESVLKTSNGANAYFARLDTPLGEQTAADTSYTRKRSADLWSSLPSSATNIDVQLKNASTSTTSSANSWLIIQASGLQTSVGGSPTNDQLLRHGGWFSSGVEQPFTF